MCSTCARREAAISLSSLALCGRTTQEKCWNLWGWLDTSHAVHLCKEAKVKRSHLTTFHAIWCG
jgi:hypothetical protein